ncbi:MAG: DNA alkylation repair protein [Clostridiales bacterium]|nr:DNA alkylation repair protein [Clostridiales bacterium]
MDNLYGKTLKYLNSQADKKYCDFSTKIANSKLPLIGVRIPLLRKVADNIFKENYEDYLENCKFEFFEDTLLYGLIIAKLSYDGFLKYLPIYLQRADSWSHIDSFVPSIKCIKNNKEKFFEYLSKNIHTAQGFHLRFFIICLMDFYLDEDTLPFVFKTCEEFDGKGYYNDMAIAWLISVAFVKFKDKTFEFIKNCNLSTFTLNKSISKIRDSFRVTAECKLLLKNFYRKN